MLKKWLGLNNCFASILLIKSKTNKSKILFSSFEPSYSDKLHSYFNSLNEETKSRFGPHPFTRESIDELAGNPEKYKMYIGVNSEDNSIVAYAIALFDWLESDTPRFLSYGITQQKGDCTFAPSVADSWQSKGIGSDLFRFIVKDLKAYIQIKRIILWGGVQSGNYKALNFYKKHGFNTLGEFEHSGSNFDMILNL